MLKHSLIAQADTVNPVIIVLKLGVFSHKPAATIYGIAAQAVVQGIMQGACFYATINHDQADRITDPKRYRDLKQYAKDHPDFESEYFGHPEYDRLDTALIAFNQYINTIMTTSRTQGQPLYFVTDKDNFNNQILLNAMRQYGIKPVWDIDTPKLDLASLLYPARALIGCRPERTIPKGGMPQHLLNLAVYDAMLLMDSVNQMRQAIRSASQGFHHLTRHLHDSPILVLVDMVLRTQTGKGFDEIRYAAVDTLNNRIVDIGLFTYDCNDASSVSHALTKFGAQMIAFSRYPMCKGRNVRLAKPNNVITFHTFTQLNAHLNMLTVWEDDTAPTLDALLVMRRILLPEPLSCSAPQDNNMTHAAQLLNTIFSDFNTALNLPAPSWVDDTEGQGAPATAAPRPTLRLAR